MEEQNESMSGQLLDDQDAMASWYDAQIAHVKANCAIVSAEQMGQNYLLHIDKNKPKEFYAKIPETTLQEENRTVARITASPTILGCLIGYGRIETDAMNIEPEKYRGGEDFRGGYTISKLMFTHAIKPNTKLVPDATLSDEYWLVNYDKDHAIYKPKSVGELVLRNMMVLPASGKNPTTIQAYSMHVLEPILLTSEMLLQKGYYFFTVEVQPTSSRVPPKLVGCIESTAGKHTNVKDAAAKNFSMEKMPASVSSWD